MKDSCDFPAFTAYHLDSQLLHIEMKKVNQLNGKDVEQMYDCYQKIGSGNKIYVMVTFQGFIPMSDDAMAEAKRQEKQDIQGAAAYVVQNFALRMGIKFFVSFYKPKYPRNICSTKPEAILWLKQKMKEKKAD